MILAAYIVLSAAVLVGFAFGVREGRDQERARRRELEEQGMRAIAAYLRRPSTGDRRGIERQPSPVVFLRKYSGVN